MPIKNGPARRAYFKERNKEPARRALKNKSKPWEKRSDRNGNEVGEFVAIDSEGFTYGEDTTPDGRKVKLHRTFLWGAGDKDGRFSWLDLAGSKDKFLAPLDVRKWLCSLRDTFPRKSIFVSFAFGYDAAQIVADLPYSKLFELQRGYPLDRPDLKSARRKHRIVLHGDFGFSYLKGKKFVLYQFEAGASAYQTGKDGKPKLKYKTRILIYDVFGFFQSSFLKACKSFPGSTTPREYEILFSGKGDRATFQPEQLEAVRPYTATELRVLARMMDRLREAMLGQQIHVRNWFGAGSIAEALLRREQAQKHLGPVEPSDYPEWQRWAHHAYFGGRIELMYQGVSKRPLHQYDVSSAYPFAALNLPANSQGTWVFVANPPDHHLAAMSPLSMVEVKANFDPAKGDRSNLAAWAIPFFPLPYRMPNGSILFPRQIWGYYFVREVEAALRWAEYYGLRSTLDVCGAWQFHPLTDDKPFAFIQGLFDYRVSLPKTDITEKVIKLGINSVYGKLAQSVGRGKFVSPWHAGAITAETRARLLDGMMLDPLAIVMVATDGIVAKKKLPLPISTKKQLGAWEYQNFDRGVFVQSGVYALVGPDGVQSKTRGFRPSNMKAGQTAADLLMSKVPKWFAEGKKKHSFSYQSYVTIGAAVASRDTAKFIGCWIDDKRELELFLPGAKRDAIHTEVLRRKRGTSLVPSEPSESNVILAADLENGGILLSDMSRPEWLDPETLEQRDVQAEQEQMVIERLQRVRHSELDDMITRFLG